MYIPKRWLVPGALSLVLTAFIMASFLANVIGGTTVTPTAVEALDVAARVPAADAAPTVLVNGAQCDPVVAPVTDAGALTEEQRADIVAYLNAVEANKNATGGNDFATNSGIVANSQFSDGGFGDIGEQWRDVAIGAPVTNIHISGVGNTTTVIIGNDNTVTVTPEPPVVEAVVADPSLASTPVEAPTAPINEIPAAQAAPIETAAA